MGRLVDLSGKAFGRLRVNSRAKSLRKGTYWNCACECGHSVVVRGTNLTTGKTASCGCSWKHGKEKTPIYNVWASMIQRCKNKNNPNYARYGGAGIGVDEKWLSFSGFYEDMGERPAGMSLDRIDGSLGYCKENCRWASTTTQARNVGKRTSKKYTQYKGVFRKQGRWYASITINKKAVYLGAFDSDVDAAIAYNTEAIKHEYFTLNKIPVDVNREDI